ncbi:hypothetical protein [Actinoplanes sp. NPDC089786]|uniref:hypothetical protein n=1 Tax=Actinoplanes sp. NPDC089786 TaxID=3155185 RepID=UPI003416308F
MVHGNADANKDVQTPASGQIGEAAILTGRRGWFSALITATAVALTAPLSVPAFAVGALIRGATLPWLRRKFSKYSGKGRYVNAELASTIVTIPAVGIIGSFGISWAFYLLAKADSVKQLPGDYSPLQDWRMVLAGTGLLSLGLLISLFRSVAGHRSGVKPLPFEEDVTPSEGVSELHKWRMGHKRFFMPTTFVFSASRADECLAKPLASQRAPGVLEVLTAGATSAKDVAQIAITSTFATLWILAYGQPAWFAGLGALATAAALIGKFIIDSYFSFFDQMRLGRRANRLGALIFGRESSSLPTGTAIANLTDRIEDLTSAVERIENTLAERERDRGWLRRWLQHK